MSRGSESWQWGCWLRTQRGERKGGSGVQARSEEWVTVRSSPLARADDRLRVELAAEGLDSVPDLGVAGDADAVAKAVGRLVEAGADTVILQPTGDEPDPEGFVRFVAEEVRALVP